MPRWTCYTPPLHLYCPIVSLPVQRAPAHISATRRSLGAANGQCLLQWGSKSEADGQFNLPWSSGLNAAGKVSVADWRNDRVQKFTLAGTFLASYGMAGDRDGEFQQPSSVAVDCDGHIYLADWGHNCREVLALDGQFRIKLVGDAGLFR